MGNVLSSEVRTSTNVMSSIAGYHQHIKLHSINQLINLSSGHKKPLMGMFFDIKYEVIANWDKKKIQAFKILTLTFVTIT